MFHKECGVTGPCLFHANACGISTRRACRAIRNVIAQFLHDDVEWAIAGPVDLIPFCGQHHGKEAALDAMVRVAPSVFRVTKLNLDELLIDGDRAAGFNRLAAIQSGTGRTITYQRAEFFQFRDNKIMDLPRRSRQFRHGRADARPCDQHVAEMRRRISPQAAIGSRFKPADALTLRYAAGLSDFADKSDAFGACALRFGGRQLIRLALFRDGLRLRNRPVASAVPLHRLRNGWFPRGTHGDLPGRIFYLNTCKIPGGQNCSTRASRSANKRKKRK